MTTPHRNVPSLEAASLAFPAVSFIAAVAFGGDRAVFVDVTERTGIDFVHVSGPPEKDWIAEVNGSGVALFDCDRDGDLDVYFVNGARWEGDASGDPPRNALYRNDGGWKFTDVTEEAGVGDAGWGAAAAVADVDNDGLLDLYVTNLGPNVLYRNLGGGRFARLERSGAEDPGWSASASFADFDRDGLVDLYVANYVAFRKVPEKRRGAGECTYKGVEIFCGPGGLEPAPDRLLRNEGGGRFRDVSEAWGIHDAAPSFGLGTLAVDLQRDGFPDLIVANDSRPNFAFLNRGGRRFTESALFLGLAYNDRGVAQASMGIASGDVRGCGRDDIFMTHFEDDTNTLYISEPDGFFSEGTYPAGLGTASYPLLGWGTFFFDAEGDGDLDLFVANGHVAPQVDGLRSSAGYRQRDQIFLHDGRGRFSECRECLPGEETRKKSSRGAAAGDLDGDGDPDMVVNAMDERPTVLENRSSGRWLAVELAGTESNRAAIGARVTLSAAGRRQERTVQSGMSYASQCELIVRFGLGGAERIDGLEVEWPSGRRERFAAPLDRGVVRLVEGRGARAGAPSSE